MSRWRFFSYPMRSGAPFLGVHLVDENNGPRCSDTLGELQPVRSRPTGYAQTCVACLEIAEWEINHG